MAEGTQLQLHLQQNQQTMNGDAAKDYPDPTIMGDVFESTAEYHNEK